MTTYEELGNSVIAGDADKVKEGVNILLKGGDSPMKIIDEGLTPSMSVVGQKMKAGEMFIPEVLASANAMNKGMEILKPLIAAEESLKLYAGKVIMGTVEGDVHRIGKGIVATILESGGFTVQDLGESVPAAKFVEAVEREQPKILGLSSLMTMTAPHMRDVIEALKRNNLRDKVQVMVGGAPITQDFADSIGADGYAPDAASALDKAKQLVGQVEG